MNVLSSSFHSVNFRPILKIISAEEVAPYLLKVSFNDSTSRLFDGRILFSGEVFQPLKDKKTFDGFKLDYETLTWMDGAIDIAPEFVYSHSSLC